MAGNGLEGIYKKREHSDSVPGSWPSQHSPPVLDSNAVRRQDEDLDPKGRRRSVSDPTKRRHATSPTRGRGLLRKLGSLLVPSLTTPRVYFSVKNYSFLPKKKLVRFHGDILASYSGPYGGLANEDLIIPSAAWNDRRASLTDKDSRGNACTDSTTHGNGNESPVFDLEDSEWRLRTETAYGMSLSLYEYRSEEKTECTGDPIADVCAIRTTCNSCIMGVADGVGWGQGARRASQCAMKGAMEYIWSTLYSADEEAEPLTTSCVFKCMRESIDKAQDLIITRNGSMTTLCLAVVADIVSDEVTSKALCVVNVGDSLAFVYSHERGVREVTIGCRGYNLHRNIQFCDGALGPCLGEEPDLGNLTFSYTTVEEGDIVFLTTDGVSDNFDPVVAKRAVASQDFKSDKCKAEIMYNDQRDSFGRRGIAGKMPALTPRERQEEMTRMMEKVISQTEVPNDNSFSASSLCSKLLQYTVNLTEGKRAAHEATNNIINICEKERLENKKMMTGKEALYQHARSLPGKLDHATVVAYVVGGNAPAVAAQSLERKGNDPEEEPGNYVDMTVGNQQNKNLVSMME